MGFLKFLKREKKDTLDELDLPPAPPPLEGFDENLPELPDFPDFGEEKISAPREMRKFDFSEEEQDMQDFGKGQMPSFPINENPPEPIAPVMSPPQISEPSPSPPSIPQEMPKPEQPSQEQISAPDIYPKIERRLFTQEKRFLRERPSGKTIYVKVDNFKTTLGSINLVRSDLRKSEEALMKLENIKNAKDKSFDKVRDSISDLQKKLIFIDKTLFKGE